MNPITGGTGIAARPAIHVRARRSALRRTKERRLIHFELRPSNVKLLRVSNRGWRNVVQNAIAAGALNDLIVATDFLERLRPQANMARGAETIACRDGN